MRKLTLAAAAITLLLTQVSFADDSMAAKDSQDDSMKPCMVIAKACKNGGFTRESGKAKTFWMDCMKPIVMGKTVAGVTVDASDVKACRDFKIEKMEKELAELKSVQ